jgi:hypothetical protein
MHPFLTCHIMPAAVRDRLCRSRVGASIKARHGSEAAWLMVHGGSAAAQDDPRRTDELLDEQSEEQTPAAGRWRRLVKHLRRVRHLQRLFGYLGQVLQWYPGRLRDRLRRVDPTASQSRGWNAGAGR